MKIRIVRTAGSYTEGAEFEIDDQVGRELQAQGIAVPVMDVTAEPAPERVREVVKPARRRTRKKRS